MMWKKKQKTQEEHQDELFFESKKIDVYMFRCENGIEFGDIEKAQINVSTGIDERLRLPYTNYTYQIYEDMWYCPNKDLMFMRYNKPIERIQRLTAPGCYTYIYICSNFETIKQYRNKLIADKYEELTHEKAIACLKKQLEEIEKGADK